ncbi:MAG: hypothetical protein ACR2QU_05490 [Gammaproteobacteria bacterium]
MNRLTALILAAALILTGCAARDPGTGTEPDCSVKQSHHIKIDYDDSKIKIRPKVLNVKKKKKFEIRLDPDKGFEDRLVTITPKTGSPAWLSGSGKVSDNTDPIVICVEDPAVIDDEYHYTVTIEDLGVVDPRVRVVP